MRFTHGTLHITLSVGPQLYDLRDCQMMRALPGAARCKMRTRYNLSTCRWLVPP